MGNPTGGRGTKVARVIEEYELIGIGEELEAAWTGEFGERTSLRNLADEFNESGLQDVGSTPIEFEVSGTYKTLFDDSEVYATRARRLNSRAGMSKHSNMILSVTKWCTRI
jgi:hypothetical protein